MNRIHFLLICGVVGIGLLGCPEDPTNMLPVADAGEDQIVSLGLGQSVALVALVGTESFDPDGTVISYEWTGIPNASDDAIQRFQLSPGEHTFQLVVTDDMGARSQPDSVTITVLDSLVAFNLDDFDDSAGLRLNTHARIVELSNNTAALRLTEDPMQIGTVFTVLPIVRNADGTVAPFATSFFVGVSDGEGGFGVGSGFTFAMVSSPGAVGSGAGDLGIGGVVPSLAVEFDYGIDPWDFPVNHIGLVENGDTQNTVNTQTLPPDVFRSFEGVIVNIEYNDFPGMGTAFRVALLTGRTMSEIDTVFLTGVDPDSVFDTDTPIYLGLTAATGTEATAHDILSWGFEAFPEL